MIKEMSEEIHVEGSAMCVVATYGVNSVRVNVSIVPSYPPDPT